MKIAVLGAGNAGCAVAADLTMKGHDVFLIKTSHAMHDDNFDYLIANNGQFTLEEFGDIKSTNINVVTRDLSKIKDCELIIIYIQTNFHEKLIQKIAKYIQDNQIILINPGYFSTAYVMKYCSTKKVIVAEAQSSFIDGRIIRPGYFKVGFRNVRNPIGIYPKARRDEAIIKLTKLNENLVFLKSVVEASLHNPNMIVHTIGAVMSIPRIEKSRGDFCMYHEAYSRDNIATWRVLEALDLEKMNILEALGLERLSYVEACKYRNSLDTTINAKEVFLEYSEMETRAKAPDKVDSRYISEDVPQGLVMLESLGKALNIDTPITTALIEIASAALGRDMREEGRKLENLGIDRIRMILNDSFGIV